MNQTPLPQGSNRWRNLTIAALAALAFFSLHLAVNRIFQVDECQNVYMSRIVALGETPRYFTNGALFILGPMSWIAAHAASSTAIYTWDRLLFLGVFWMNLCLVALNTGARLGSRAFLYALLAAATLPPLWDYGFEIRHDNILLLLLLTLWWVLRHSKLRAEAAFAAIGLLSAIAQFISFKAFLYWFPLSAVALLFPPANLRAPVAKRIGFWLAGLLTAVVCAFLIYKASGAWTSFLNGFRTSVGHTENPERFAPWISLNRLPLQMPLVTAMGAGLLAASVRELFKRGKEALTWDGPIPESLLLLGALAILLINPVPYPYNLVLLAPFVFLAAARWIPDLAVFFGRHESLPLLAATVALFTHALPFCIQTARHLDVPNTRQEQLMDLAEAVTDPAKDRVYDATGLVATRESVHFQWFLHSLVMPKIASGQLPTVRTMLAGNPPSVVIASYRTDWLSDEDRAYVSQHYVPLADDFFVLGASLPEGGGVFECIHPGRYTIAAPSPSRPGAGSQAIMVDGRPAEGPMELAIGAHRIASPAGVKPAVIWLGPTLGDVRTPGAADHRALFINWY